VVVAQPHEAATLTYEKIPCPQRTGDFVDLIPGLDVVW
jgi:hypothetical protein